MLRPMRTTRSRTSPTSQPMLVAVALFVLMGLAGVAQPATSGPHDPAAAVPALAR